MLLGPPPLAPRDGSALYQVDASQGSRASPPLVLRFCLLNALSLPRAFAGPSHTGPAGKAPAVVTEAQGWRLHLSSRSSTVYAGVHKQEQASGSRDRRPPWASGRFAAYHTVDGRRVYIGSSTRRWRRRWHARAEGSVDGQVAARRARGALDWETTSLWGLDPVLMIVHD